MRERWRIPVTDPVPRDLPADRRRSPTQNGGGGVQRVRFADRPASLGVHLWSFGDVVAGVGYCPGQTSTMSRYPQRPIDKPYSRLSVGLPKQVRGNSCRGGRELFARDLPLGTGLDDGVGMCPGVKIHADYEWAGLRNDSQRGHAPQGQLFFESRAPDRTTGINTVS